MTTRISANKAIAAEWWVGRSLTRYEAQYTWVALGFDDGSVVVLSVEEVSVGKWFEVFPLKVDISTPNFLSNHAYAWIALLAPLRICRVESLWREEWLEPAQDSSQLLGSGPAFVQHAAPLHTAPLGVDAIEVEAGIALQGVDGRHVILCSSDNSPFKIDFATEAGQIEDMQQCHTVQ
jgi:hypothetical protein